MGGDECRDVIRGRRKVSSSEAAARPSVVCLWRQGPLSKRQRVEQEVAEFKIPAAI